MYRRGELALRELARQIELHTDSFEALPFELRQELQSLARKLERQAEYADEECQYEAEVECLLSALSELLLKLPR